MFFMCPFQRLISLPWCKQKPWGEQQPPQQGEHSTAEHGEAEHESEEEPRAEQTEQNSADDKED